ncbi:MAG: S8 family serine peptidase [Acidobacteriota bacterium]
MSASGGRSTDEPVQRTIQPLHAITRGRPEIRVAVLDGPVDTAHEAFRDARLDVLDDGLAPGEPARGAAAVHGTLVASILFGREGIAPGCHGLAIPIYRQDLHSHTQPASQLLLASAIDRAVDAGAHVINVSGGQRTLTGDAETELLTAVERCQRRNVLIVAAVGNDGCACLHVPGALPSVLAVAAADAEGRPLESSNWSGPYQVQGLLAPGARISGARAGGGSTQGSGSSYATAVVSGVAALLLSVQARQGQPVDPHRVRRALLHTVSRCDPAMTTHCHRHLAGHLNPRAALSLVNPGAIPMSESNVSDHQSVDTAAPAPTSTEPSPAILPSSAEHPASAQEAATGVEPSDCACGGGAQSQLAYVLGQIDYDFGTLENFEWFKQNARVGGSFINPNDRSQVLAYLEEHPAFASTLIWTVTIAGVPVYSIHPEACYCDAVYNRLRKFLSAQIDAEKTGDVAISTLPAKVHGSTRLLNGAVVPTLSPDPRGMFNFTDQSLLDNLQSLLGISDDPSDGQKAQVASYLHYVVDKMRNLGRTAQDRAINYLTIQGYLAFFRSHNGLQQDADVPNDFDGFRLLGVDAGPNAFCQPGGDCQDVTLTFFNPNNAVNVAPLVYRQTVDVAAVNPVLVGQPAFYRTR